jgi:hypothetical protein
MARRVSRRRVRRDCTEGADAIVEIRVSFRSTTGLKLLGAEVGRVASLVVERLQHDGSRPG